MCTHKDNDVEWKMEDFGCKKEKEKKKMKERKVQINYVRLAGC